MTIPAITSYSLPEPSALPVNRVDWQCDPAKAVLLIHDMQNYFVNYYGQSNSLISTLQDNIVAIRDWADQWAIPVVYTAQPEDQSAEDRALLTDMWGPGLQSTEPTAKDIISALQPRVDDTVLVKWRYSAFQRSPMRDLMTEWRRDQLIIVGIYAHIGCMMTACDAFMRDIKPFLVADAVADFSAQDHQMALDYVANRCGKVIATADLLNNVKPQITFDWLRSQLLECIDEDEAFFDADENLVDYGLDSVQVMTMIEKWDRMGLIVKVDDLLKEPTLNGWWRAIEKMRS